MFVIVVNTHLIYYILIKEQILHSRSSEEMCTSVIFPSKSNFVFLQSSLVTFVSNIFLTGAGPSGVARMCAYTQKVKLFT